MAHVVASSDPNRPRLHFLLIGLLSLWCLGLLSLSWSTIALVEQQGLQSVQAHVENVRYESGAGNRVSYPCAEHDNAWQVFVTYSYKVAGRRYTANRYEAQHRGEVFCAKKKARARVKALEQRGTVTAYYQPDNPQQAVRHPESGSEIATLWALLGVSGVVLWGFFIRYLVRRRRYRRAVSTGDDSALW